MTIAEKIDIVKREVTDAEKVLETIKADLGKWEKRLEFRKEVLADLVDKSLNNS